MLINQLMLVMLMYILGRLYVCLVPSVAAGREVDFVREGDRAAEDGDAQGEGDDQGVAAGAAENTRGAERGEPEAGALRAERADGDLVHATTAKYSESTEPGTLT